MKTPQEKKAYWAMAIVGAIMCLAIQVVLAMGWGFSLFSGNLIPDELVPVPVRLESGVHILTCPA